MALRLKKCHPDIERSEDGGTLRRLANFLVQAGMLLPIAAYIVHRTRMSHF